MSRSLRILFLEESSITHNGPEWLHELAINNSVLVSLNFYMTDLTIVPSDLELLALNCRSLISVKISDCDLSDLVGFFRAASALEDFGGGSFSDQPEEANQPVEANRYSGVVFPARLCCLGLTYMAMINMHIIFPLCAALKKLDLQYTFLTTEDHCNLIQRCPYLQVLEVWPVID